MNTDAIVLNGPRALCLGDLPLVPPGADDLVVDIAHSGISTGTEKLFWSGDMPPFPGMGFPLVPGYEAAGEVVEAGAATGFRPGDTVFFEPDEKHWHGASPHAAMTHIALQEELDGSAVTWMEHVTDAEYAAQT